MIHSRASSTHEVDARDRNKSLNDFHKSKSVLDLGKPLLDHNMDRTHSRSLSRASSNHDSEPKRHQINSSDAQLNEGSFNSRKSLLDPKMDMSLSRASSTQGINPKSLSRASSTQDINPKSLSRALSTQDINRKSLSRASSNHGINQKGLRISESDIQINKSSLDTSKSAFKNSDHIGGSKNILVDLTLALSDCDEEVKSPSQPIIPFWSKATSNHSISGELAKPPARRVSLNSSSISTLKFKTAKQFSDFYSPPIKGSGFLSSSTQYLSHLPVWKQNGSRNSLANTPQRNFNKSGIIVTQQNKERTHNLEAATAPNNVPFVSDLINNDESQPPALKSASRSGNFSRRFSVTKGATTVPGITTIQEEKEPLYTQNCRSLSDVAPSDDFKLTSERILNLDIHDSDNISRRSSRSSILHKNTEIGEGTIPWPSLSRAGSIASTKKDFYVTVAPISRPTLSRAQSLASTNNIEFQKSKFEKLSKKVEKISSERGSVPDSQDEKFADSSSKVDFIDEMQEIIHQTISKMFSDLLMPHFEKLNERCDKMEDVFYSLQEKYTSKNEQMNFNDSKEKQKANPEYKSRNEQHEFCGIKEKLEIDDASSFSKIRRQYKDFLKHYKKSSKTLFSRTSDMHQELQNLKQSITENNQQEIETIKKTVNIVSRKLETKVDVAVLEELARHITPSHEFKNIHKTIESILDIKINSKINLFLKHLGHSLPDSETVESISEKIALSGDLINERINQKVSECVHRRVSSKIRDMQSSIRMIEESNKLNGTLSRTDSGIGEDFKGWAKGYIDKLIIQDIKKEDSQMSSSLFSNTRSRKSPSQALVGSKKTADSILHRELDEKLYMLSTELSACKSLFSRQSMQPFYRCAQWIWNSSVLKQGSAVPWNQETVNTGISQLIQTLRISHGL